MGFWVLACLAFIGGAVVFCSSRTAQLKQMARTLHLRYDARVENLLTPFAAQDVYLFNHTPHRFKQVLTWREPNAFIRVCEAEVVQPGETAVSQRYTLVAAELTRGTLEPFILQPRAPEDTSAAHPALPAELATKFTLKAPDHFQFSPEALGLLKAGPLCYLEATTCALIYHTYQTIPVRQIQPMRLRVQQLIRSLVRSVPASALPLQATATAPMLAELQAQSLLNLHAPTQPGTSSPSAMRFVYLAFGVGFLIAILWLAQHLLRSFVH